MERNYEKLGAFFLGREVDPDSGDVSETPLLYESKDLTTHGVIIGMTGSGKTGLGIGLLEEAAMDRIPVLAVDPKGDLANLLLTFPDLAPESFLPWVNEESARQQGLSTEAYASQQSELWRKGLSSWGQDGERIRKLREQVDIAVYTPGSSAGLPVSVLRSFDAPPQALIDDADGFRDRVQSTVTGLLGLLGIDADPIRSREHILLSSILDDAWRKGRSLDLGALIQAIQQPPFTRLGVMELESVYPAKDRFELAMQLNALLASPGFQGWMEGEPLDIASMLYTREGKPRLTIFSIAHLGDAERMFFVTMLLSAVVGWMRTQKGTTTLRALVYMDEIFGFFPPVANPPSKGPMLTLLKQARAFGVGMVLATQNPVDLDYKGLGNTGTWFIGRLQTDRDKQRVLEALDGAMAGSTPIPREELDRLLSGLGKRVFLMHNVHRGVPSLFTTRWAMSYLAGPLTLGQIRTLTDGRRTDGAGSSSDAGVAALPDGGNEIGIETASAGAPPGSPTPAVEVRPILPAEIRQLFVPPFARGEGTVYRPAFLLSAEVRYSSSRHGVEETRSITVIGDLEDTPLPFSLDRLNVVQLPLEHLEDEPASDIAFTPLPAEGAQPKSYGRWSKEVVRWIQGAAPITLFESKAHKVFSAVGESEADFRMRLADLGHEEKDARTDRLKQKYEPRLRTLEERLRRAEQAVQKRESQSKQAILSTGLSTLGAILGAAGGKGKKGGGLLGAILGGGAGRATTAMRSAGRAAQTRQDVEHAAETVDAVEAQIQELDAEFQAELRKIEDSADSTEVLQETTIRPALNAISPRIVALVWFPWGTDLSGNPTPFWR